MTIGTVKTQGTELYFVNDAHTVVKISCPTGITGLGGAADRIETTCLDTTGDKQYAAGLGDPSQVSVPFNMIPTDTSHQALLALKESGETVHWLIGLSDGTTQPTVDTDFAFIPPTGRSSITFDGYVADFNLDIATNEIVKGTMTIQRSGTPTLTPKV
jgi:hypothetical protein